MSEDAPAPEEGTQETPEGGDPQVEAPTTTPDWDSEDNPYRQRYEDLRPQANQWKSALDQNQQLIEALRDPARQAEVLKYFDIELEPDPEELDDLEQPLTRAEWQAWQQQQVQAQQQAVQADQALEADTQFTKSELQRLGISEDDKSLDLLLPLAFRFRGEDGQLGIEQAHKMLRDFSEADRKAYLKSKSAPQVAPGSAGTDKVNLADEDERRRVMAETMAAAEALDV